MNKISGEPERRRRRRSRFRAEEHPSGGKSQGGRQVSIAVFVSSTAHRMIGSKLRAAQGVADRHQGRDNDREDYRWATDTGRDPDAYKDTGSDHRPQAHHRRPKDTKFPSRRTMGCCVGCLPGSHEPNPRALPVALRTIVNTRLASFQDSALFHR
jgi:hypothetical protein